jgi:hypothetical protein
VGVGVGVGVGEVTRLSTTENTIVIDGPGVPAAFASGYGVATTVCVPTDKFAAVKAPFVSPARE